MEIEEVKKVQVTKKMVVEVGIHSIRDEEGHHAYITNVSTDPEGALIIGIDGVLQGEMDAKSVTEWAADNMGAVLEEACADGLQKFVGKALRGMDPATVQELIEPYLPKPTLETAIGVLQDLQAAPVGTPNCFPDGARPEAKVGEKLILVEPHPSSALQAGTVVTLTRNDKSECPWFSTPGYIKTRPIAWKRLRPLTKQEKADHEG